MAKISSSAQPEPSLQSHNPRYRPDIDGLRAIAVAAVVAFHAFPDWVSGGYVGVDIFFVISGFLISGVILGEMGGGATRGATRGEQGGGFSYRAFYARRIRRIFPALAVVLAACLACGWFLLDARDFMQLGKHTAAGAGFVSNLVLWSEAGYFDGAADLKPLLHLWSLGIEEQFYIFWPLALGIAWRYKKQLPVLIALAAAASLILCVHLTGTDSVAAFFSPLSRVWELALGGLLACIAQPGAAQARRANFHAAAGLGLLGLAILLFNSGTAFPGWAALLPVAGAALVIAAGPAAWCNRRLLAARPLVWLGLISYPLYLWHWPVLVFAKRLELTGSAATRGLIVIGASTCLAWLTYRLVEMPVRSRQASGPLAGALLAVMLAIGCLGAAVYATGGLGVRAANQKSIDAQRWATISQWTDEDYFSPACHQQYPEAYFCKLDPGAAPMVALVGDSFANSLYYGLRDHYRKRGATLLHLGNGGCPPLLGITSDFASRNDNQCPAKTAAYFRRIAEDSRIHTVVMAANWHVYIKGRRFRELERQPPEWIIRLPDTPALTNNPEVFATAFERTVRYLESAGKRIVFIHQPPELDYRPSACSLQADSTASCRTDRKKVEAYLKEYQDVVAPLLAKHPAIASVDPIGLFCDAQYCYLQRDGVVLYRDALHLSREGARYLGERIVIPGW